MIASRGATTRVVAILVLSAATAGMVLISLRANFLFGYGFGRNAENAHVFGWANVAADVWKVFGLILVGGLWRNRQKRLALSLLPIWLLCLLWGMAGAVGVYAQDRARAIGDREIAAGAYEDVDRQIADLTRKLSTMTTRTVGQIDAAISAVLARPVKSSGRLRGSVGKLSNNCTREDAATVDACLDVARLKEERTSAEEAARVGSRIAEMQLERDRLVERGGALPTDPAAEFIAWLTSDQLRVSDIRFGFPLVFALLIEFISAFGPAAITAYERATRASQETPKTELKPDVALRLTSARLSEPERVAHWMTDRTDPTGEGQGVSVEWLFSDYRAWSADHNMVAGELAVFQSTFDRIRELNEVRGSIRKFGARYYGIRLRSTPRGQQLVGKS